MYESEETQVVGQMLNAISSFGRSQAMSEPAPPAPWNHGNNLHGPSHYNAQVWSPPPAPHDPFQTPRRPSGAYTQGIRPVNSDIQDSAEESSNQQWTNL